MGDDFTMGDKHYMHLNGSGNANGEASAYCHWILACSNGKSATQNYEPIVLLLWKEMFNAMRYAKPEPGLTFRFTKDEVLVQSGSSANTSQKRASADGSNGRNKRQRRDCM
ncbi:hypothetical protein LTS09_017141 [Friedmanniomyces endolithicus]|nr:hypothetical protein LTS09_017141 [Friedmanniomyces endolithicus]